jgi:hypothetical protein
LGFKERIRGSHHIFSRHDIPEILNLQPKGTKAKRYQVKQVRGILVKYLTGDAANSCTPDPHCDASAGKEQPNMSDDVLVKVEGVSKKFCRSLKRSLWYGVKTGRAS